MLAVQFPIFFKDSLEIRRDLVEPFGLAVLGLAADGKAYLVHVEKVFQMLVRGCVDVVNHFAAASFSSLYR